MKNIVLSGSASYRVSTILLVFILGACQPQGKSSTIKKESGEMLASGHLLSIGNEHLVLQSEEHVMFVSVGEVDKQRLLTILKKGDTITLVGKRDVEVLDTGQQRMSADVYGILKQDGTLIALNHD